MIRTWTAAVATAKRLSDYLGRTVAVYEHATGGYSVRPPTDRVQAVRPHLGRPARLIVGRINGEMCTW